MNVRVCKFLCGDQVDENSNEVRVRLHIDSSAAMGTIQRAGFGRMKHLQIRHLFLQDLLRMKVFSLRKVSTKINPADLGTKKLGLKRRKDLSRLIGIFIGEDETSKRSEVLQTRRVQMLLSISTSSSLTLARLFFSIFIPARQLQHYFNNGRLQAQLGTWWNGDHGHGYIGDDDEPWYRFKVTKPFQHWICRCPTMDGRDAKLFGYNIYYCSQSLLD